MPPGAKNYNPGDPSDLRGCSGALRASTGPILGGLLAFSSRRMGTQARASVKRRSPQTRSRGRGRLLSPWHWLSATTLILHSHLQPNISGFFPLDAFLCHNRASLAQRPRVIFLSPNRIQKLQFRDSLAIGQTWYYRHAFPHNLQIKFQRVQIIPPARDEILLAAKCCGCSQDAPSSGAQ